MHDIYSVLTELGIYVPGYPNNRSTAFGQWSPIFGWKLLAEDRDERIARARQVNLLLERTEVRSSDSGPGLTWDRSFYHGNKAVVEEFVDLVQLHLKRSKRRYEWSWERGQDGGPTKVLWLLDR